MGKWPDFEYHVGKWLRYDRFGSNSSQPTLVSPLNLGDAWGLGDPWRPWLNMVKMAKIWKHSSLTFLNHFFLLKYFLDQTLHWCFRLHWVKLWFVFSLNLFLGVSLSGIYDESIISWSYSESYFGFGRNFVKTWIEFSHLTLFLILRVLPELAQR